MTDVPGTTREVPASVPRAPRPRQAPDDKAAPHEGETTVTFTRPPAQRVTEQAAPEQRVAKHRGTGQQGARHRGAGHRGAGQEPAKWQAIEREPGNGEATLALSALFVVSLLVFVGGRATDSGTLRLIGLGGALFFGVGTAPLQLSSRARLDLRLGVGVLVGLSVPLIVASVMVLTPWWHPVLVAAVIAVAAAGLHAWACVRVLVRRAQHGVFHWEGQIARPPVVAIMLLSWVNALWCAAAISAGHLVPGLADFLPRISVPWCVGLASMLAGVALLRGRNEWYAISCVVSLLAALTATPALIYGMPRSQSAAKHIDLVQTILQAHYLDRGAGIYQAYSGFFSAVAWLCDLAGIHDPTGIATWWPFVIGLLGLVELRLFLGRLTSSRYRIWAVIALVVLANAIGADYFSPQSVGFVLAVGVFALALPDLKRSRDPEEGKRPNGLNEDARIWLLVMAGCALAVTHELSPYIVGGVLVVLVIFRTIGPWYVPATSLLPALGWALANAHDLSGFVSLADLGSLSNFAPPKTVVTPGLQRLPIVGQSAHALALGLLILAILAGIGLLRSVKDRSSWAFMLCAGVGLVMIVANPYGNEGIFRAALFGIPWLAAVALRAVPERPRYWVTGLYVVVAAVLCGTYLVAMFGLDNANVIRPGDLQALRIYQDQASTSSYLLTMSYGDLPVSIDFPALSDHFVVWNSLVEPAQVRTTTPAAGDANVLARNFYLDAQATGGASHELYAIYSPASVAYSVDYGLETLGQAQAWRDQLLASPDWHLVYASDGTYLFRDVITAHQVEAKPATHKKAKRKVRRPQHIVSQPPARSLPAPARSLPAPARSLPAPAGARHRPGGGVRLPVRGAHRRPPRCVRAVLPPGRCTLPSTRWPPTRPGLPLL